MTVTSKARVLVGVDGSASACKALEWALHYADAVGGQVVAVSVWHGALYVVGPGVMPPPPYDAGQAAQDTLTAAVTAVAGARASAIEQRIENGSPAEVLIDLSRDADLLVVGSRGHGGFTGMLLGSVSSHCVHHAHCPVAVIRD